jgi:purine nucleosidase
MAEPMPPRRKIFWRTIVKTIRLGFAFFALLLVTPMVWGQARRKVIVNQDCAGPGGSNMNTLLMMIQAPNVDVLGITVVSGDQWRDEEVAHTLRMLEIIGRTDIPVFAGALHPLVRTYEEAVQWQEVYGKVAYAGAWDPRWYHPATVVPNLPEGNPTTKAAAEDAAHFMVRMVRKYPHEVTIYEGGPMTNLALAMGIDPEFPELAQELDFMGGSLLPISENPEFNNTPRHEFNFWFDPEAADKVLHGNWKKIVCTPTDISVKTKVTAAMMKQIEASGTPLALYVSKNFHPGMGSDYMWDELAAGIWLDPTLITKSETLYMGVDTAHSAGYGNTLTWGEKYKPKITPKQAQILVEVDAPRFYKLFVDLMSAPVQQPSAAAH